MQKLYCEGYSDSRQSGPRCGLWHPWALDRPSPQGERWGQCRSGWGRSPPIPGLRMESCVRFQWGMRPDSLGAATELCDSTILLQGLAQKSQPLAWAFCFLCPVRLISIHSKISLSKLVFYPLRSHGNLGVFPGQP